MKWLMTALLVFGFIHVPSAMSHPSSGIAVDSGGDVYFIDTGAGVWQLPQNGTLNKLPGPAYHWLALDRAGRLAKTDLPSFTENGATLSRGVHNLFLSSDFPISIDSKGSLLYPRIVEGQLRIMRLESSGSTSTLATVGNNTKGQPLRWINGSASGRDGSFYYTEDRGVWKITSQGEVVSLYSEMPKAECDSVPGVGSQFGPMFQGIDIDPQGNVFVAATGCRAVLRISPNRVVTTASRTSGAWSPTAVATFEYDVYVLEYFHTAGHDRREWIPRIRKIAADGTESILATVKRR